MARPEPSRDYAGADTASENRQSADLSRMAAAEAAGSGLLTLIVVAAGIFGERYAIHNTGIALLITSLAGASAFFILARTLAPLAPTAFNPGLALGLALAGRLPLSSAVLCVAAQIAGAFLGVMAAHVIGNTGLVQVATQIQTGEGVWLGEFIGTGLLVFALLPLAFAGSQKLPLTGALCLLAISLATPSTSFADPAMTLARALTDSFTSIRLEDALAICGIQLVAAALAYALRRFLFPAD